MASCDDGGSNELVSSEELKLTSSSTVLDSALAKESGLRMGCALLWCSAAYGSPRKRVIEEGKRQLRQNRRSPVYGGLADLLEHRA